MAEYFGSDEQIEEQMKRAAKVVQELAKSERDRLTKLGYSEAEINMKMVDWYKKHQI